MWLTDFIIFYMCIGYGLNNILALFALYTNDNVEVSMSEFVLTIPAWPYTLYQVIAGTFDKD